ncbi:DEP domain-containing protein 7 isoform X3 [Stigmatopora nigra]
MRRTSEGGMAGKPFRATQIWSSIISNLHTHVEVKRRRHNLKSYQDCFLGSEAVDAVLAHITLNRFFGDEAVPRHKAVRLCQALMDSKVFEPVAIKVFGKEKKRVTFEDSSCSLYRFPSPETGLGHLTDTKSSSTVTIESGYDSPGISRNKNSYSPLSERQEVPSYSTHSPVRKGKSVEDVLRNLNLCSTVTPQMINLGLSRELVAEVWHQQAVYGLLQLIELPLLENLLDGNGVSRVSLHGGDSESDLLLESGYLDREVLRAFSEAQADEWMSGAVDCLEYLPDEQVVEVSKGLAGCANDFNECKRLLYDILAKHYSKAEHPPLLSNHVFDIYSGISELLVNGKLEQALEALQLSLKLQDSRSREELRRLLRFMAIAANVQDIKIHKEVPFSLHKMVSERLKNIVKGKDADVITGPTYCTKKSKKSYSENAEEYTKEELWSLLRTIHENPNMPSKEKRRLLAQFYKGHPDIFVKYFGKKILSMNMLL